MTKYYSSIFHPHTASTTSTQSNLLLKELASDGIKRVLLAHHTLGNPNLHPSLIHHSASLLLTLGCAFLNNCQAKTESILQLSNQTAALAF